MQICLRRSTEPGAWEIEDNSARSRNGKWKRRSLDGGPKGRAVVRLDKANGVATAAQIAVWRREAETETRRAQTKWKSGKSETEETRNDE